MPKAKKIQPNNKYLNLSNDCLMKAQRIEEALIEGGSETFSPMQISKMKTELKKLYTLVHAFDTKHKMINKIKMEVQNA
jgi:hypothetical protein|tara:strand:- start:218 stop:454 length:237 start_codon:yes stop_codon:yes gene_type:complete